MAAFWSKGRVTMPFTEEQFFAVFAAWNSAVWPLQVTAYLLGFGVLGLLRGSRTSTAAVMFALALMWLVNGIGYHWLFFSEINPAARYIAGVFVLEALMMLAFPIVAPGFRIAPAKDARTVIGLGLMIYALLIYPLLGRLAGHVYPAVPVFGIAPCPTTIFTIGVLLLGSWGTARWLLMIPALWGVVGGSAAVLLGVPQDYGLIVATLVVLGLAIGRRAGADFAWHAVDTG